MFAILCIIILLLIYYIKRSYFTVRNDLPGLSPHVLFGNLIQSGILFGGMSLAKALYAFKIRFGDVFQFWLGSLRIIVVSGTEDVKHIFTHRNIYDKGDLSLRTFGLFFFNAMICNRGLLIIVRMNEKTCCLGAKYKRHAALIMPLFRRNKITSNFDLMIDNVDKLLSRWHADDHNRIHKDIVQQSQQLVLSIFGFIAFDYDLETLEGKEATGNKLTLALQDFVSAFQALMFLPFRLASLYWRFNPRYRRARQIIQQYLYRMMEQELAESDESRAQRKRTCLIASLVSSLQTDEVSEAAKSEEDKRGLSRQEVLDELLLFLVAGYETTSTALAWFIHLVSKHPRVQQKIKVELMENNGNRQDLSVEQIDSLVYLDCVINEVLQFCPPIMGSVRTVGMDDCLPQSGTKLYKGEQVYVSFYNLGHDTRFWTVDPELFCPERFINEDKNHPDFAFLPFSYGHRQCIGQDLARFELKVIAARLMQRVTFNDAGPDVNAGGHFARITIMPKHVGVTVHFD